MQAQASKQQFFSSKNQTRSRHNVKQKTRNEEMKEKNDNNNVGRFKIFCVFLPLQKKSLEINFITISPFSNRNYSNLLTLISFDNMQISENMRGDVEVFFSFVMEINQENVTELFIKVKFCKKNCMFCVAKRKFLDDAQPTSTDDDFKAIL